MVSEWYSNASRLSEQVIFFLDGLIFSVSPSYFFLLGRICLLILEGEEWGEGGRGRETNINWLPLVGPRPDRNLNLGMCPWLGSEPETFWCMEQHCNQLSHLANDPSPFEMNFGA